MSLGAKFERLLEAHIVCAHQSEVQEFRNVLQVYSLHPVAHRSDTRACPCMVHALVRTSARARVCVVACAEQR
jgi:hypothetical protein